MTKETSYLDMNLKDRSLITILSKGAMTYLEKKS